MTQAADRNRAVWEQLYQAGNYMRYPVEQLVRLFYRHARRMLAPGALVVDYGAGSGNNAEFFVREGCRVIAMDISATALDVLQRRFMHAHLPAPECRLVEPGAEVMIPECDLLVFWDVLYYNDAETARTLLREGIAALRPGGMLMVNMPTPRHHFIANATQIAADTFEFRGADQQGAIMCTPGSMQALVQWCAGITPVEQGGFAHYNAERRAEFMHLVGRKE